MKRALVLVSFLLALSVQAADRQVVEEIVARVNDEIITRTELEQQRLELRRELSQQFSGQSLEEAYHDRELHLLRDMIDHLLLVQKGREMGISVESETVKRMDAIRQQMNLKSMEELERAVEAQGLSFEEFRSRIRSNILTNQVLQRLVSGRVTLSADEISGYYEAHKQEFHRPETWKLREILVATTSKGRTDEEARARVQEVLTRIRKGEKFDALAKEFSDAPTAENGGELGEFQRGQLAPELAETVAKLREGAVSDALVTRDGYLLLEVAQYTPEGIPPFERVEDEIRERLFMQRVQPTLREVLTDLRMNAYVEVKPGYVDTGAAKRREPPKRKRGRTWRRLRERKEKP